MPNDNSKKNWIAILHTIESNSITNTQCHSYRNWAQFPHSWLHHILQILGSFLWCVLGPREFIFHWNERGEKTKASSNSSSPIRRIYRSFKNFYHLTNLKVAPSKSPPPESCHYYCWCTWLAWVENKWNSNANWDVIISNGFCLSSVYWCPLAFSVWRVAPFR